MHFLSILEFAKDDFIAISDDGRISLNKIVDGNPTALATSEAKLNGRIWNTAAFADDMMLVRDKDYIYALKFQGNKK